MFIHRPICVLCSVHATYPAHPRRLLVSPEVHIFTSPTSLLTGNRRKKYFIPFYVVPCIAARGTQRCTVVPRACGHYHCYYAKFLFVSTVRGGPLKPAVCPVTEQNVHHTSGSASRCGCSVAVDAASCCQEKFNFYPCLPATSHVTPRPTYTVQDWEMPLPLL